jgi:hypothetical protein
MSYEKGFRRLYDVVAAAWMLYWLGAGLLSIFLNKSSLTGFEILLLLTAICIVPPLGYVILFFLVPWITRAFRSSEK